MSLISCGGSHEIERDEEYCETMDTIDECTVVEDGVVLTLADGSRYHVQVKRL